jgi:hypothetical protein
MRVTINQPDRWVVPENARRHGLTHQFTHDGVYVGSTWNSTGLPFVPVGCSACARSGICGCVRFTQVTC